MSFFNALLTILLLPLGIGISFEFIATLLTPKQEQQEVNLSLVCCIKLLQLTSNTLWIALIWALFLTGFLLRSAVYWRKATLNGMLDEAKAFSRDLTTFDNFSANAKPWSITSFKQLILLAFLGSNNVLEHVDHKLGNGFMPLLPIRSGRHPLANGISAQEAPDRSPPEVASYLHTCIGRLASNDVLRFNDGFIIPNTQALQAHCNRVTDRYFRPFGCEIASWDPDSSDLHVLLHPDDVNAVIAAGWGERHPLARVDSAWNWWFDNFEDRKPVPEFLTRIYPPMTMKEVEVVMEIVEAGALYVADPRTAMRSRCAGCENHHQAEKEDWYKRGHGMV